MAELGQRGRPRAVPDDVVEQIAIYRRAGMGWRSIARLLNAQGFVTGHGAPYWRPATVRWVAINRGLAESCREPSANGKLGLIRAAMLEIASRCPGAAGSD